jgi:hypothetical protein
LDRIQTIVHSRNIENFDDIAETALEEECAIWYRKERYKVDQETLTRVDAVEN